MISDHTQIQDNVIAVACDRCGGHCVAIYAKTVDDQIRIDAWCPFCERHASDVELCVYSGTVPFTYIN